MERILCHKLARECSTYDLSEPAALKMFIKLLFLSNKVQTCMMD